jgi:hypothetical protein
MSALALRNTSKPTVSSQDSLQDFSPFSSHFLITFCLLAVHVVSDGQVTSCWVEGPNSTSHRSSCAA